ncbi:MAG TPA: proline dehydrogenase [Flavobacteriales bacterium]|nr:proline dehydrogenase [Flavobacteriales bacterium]
MNSPMLTGISTSLAEVAMSINFPVSWAAKPTVFRVFCGGETIDESLAVVKTLGVNSVGAILDYSVEGQESESEFAKTEAELIRIVGIAKGNPDIPVTCMKISGIASNRLLEKLSSGADLDDPEKVLSGVLHKRFERICQANFDAGVPVYVDAEESWIQPAIDRLVESMMAKFNTEKAIVFQTVQMFRHDRLAYYNDLILKARRSGFKVGVKVVRGAYLDKENKRASEGGYPTPIQASKQATDQAYNDAMKLSVENIDWVEVCAGTHNEYSLQYLAWLMKENGLQNDHPNIYFSQLYGMSDYMSFNLASDGYNVSKYLPYGPVKFTLPYLIRRAKENTAIAGQMGKEFTMILKERNRRKELA